jgi:hypothetical protein
VSPPLSSPVAMWRRSNSDAPNVPHLMPGPFSSCQRVETGGQERSAREDGRGRRRAGLTDAVCSILPWSSAHTVRALVPRGCCPRMTKRALCIAMVSGAVPTAGAPQATKNRTRAMHARRPARHPANAEWRESHALGAVLNDLRGGRRVSRACGRPWARKRRERAWGAGAAMTHWIFWGQRASSSEQPSPELCSHLGRCIPPVAVRTDVTTCEGRVFLRSTFTFSNTPQRRQRPAG